MFYLFVVLRVSEGRYTMSCLALVHGIEELFHQELNTHNSVKYEVV